jgi:predicted RNase H-like HicB family nuclease
MEKIRVDIDWCDKNFGASIVDYAGNSIVVTAKTYDELLQEIKAAIRDHIDGLISDGDKVPEWFKNGAYSLDYKLTTAALLRTCEPYASIAAISRVTGINQQLLSHYANGIKKPRAAQRKRIVDGIHQIGEKLITVC